jgi:hypothetical protein
MDDVNDELSTDYNDITEASTQKTGKIDPDFYCEVETNDAYVTITSTINKKATGNITIEIRNPDDESKTVNGIAKIEDGTATWAEFIAFDKGQYYADVTYSGDDNYNSFSRLKEFEIEKYTTDLMVRITKYDAFIIITTITVNETATGNVTIRIKTTEEENFTEYATEKLEGGVAIWYAPEIFHKGDYVAFTQYNGDANFFKAGNTQTFSIEKEIPEFGVNVTVNDYLVVLNATLPQNATGNVTVKIKTVEEENYTEFGIVRVENGSAVWADFIPFNKGDYIAYAIYNGDANYFTAEDVQEFTIEKQFPELLINNTVDGFNATITVTLPENATGTVTLTDNQTGEVETVTLNGTAISFNENLTYGNNIFIISYSGDDYYYGLNNTVVEPVKYKTSLNVKSTIKITYLYTSKIAVELSILDGNVSLSDGEPVTIVVNNRQYTGILNNGTATIDILVNATYKFYPKTYKAKVVFDGNDLLEKSSASFKFVVKKATPILTAKAKSFKVSTKTKKYTITLKNKKGKLMKKAKVTLKVNGKTFNATTNSKGQATFKITNLNKKAKYYALISYAGSKYYNEISKKVLINVKR